MATKLSLNKQSLVQGKKLAAIFENYIESIVGKKPKTVALLLSAGVDSTSVGLAAKALGHKVHAYTFQLGDAQSFDSRWAEKTARILDWEWTLVKLPTSIKQVVRDWPTMYDDYTCRKKRDFECMWPFLYVYPQIKEKFVLSGLVADMHFVFSRKYMVAKIAGPGCDFDKYCEHRTKMWSPMIKRGYKALCEDYNPSGLWMHYRLQQAYNLVDVNPFLCPETFKLFIKFSWDELNYPRQKHFVVGAYPELMQYIGHRNHQNYQLAANIDHFFEKLLPTKINFRNRSRTLDMFRDWSRYGVEAQAIVDAIKDKAK